MASGRYARKGLELMVAYVEPQRLLGRPRSWHVVRNVVPEGGAGGEGGRGGDGGRRGGRGGTGGDGDGGSGGGGDGGGG